MFKKKKISLILLPFLTLGIIILVSACSNTNNTNDLDNNLNNNTNNLEINLDTNTNTMENKEINMNLANEYQYVTLKTNKGDIKIEMFGDKTPVTVSNFLSLAQKGFYNQTKFHRVIKDFMIQGGDPLTKDDAMVNRWGTGGPGYAIDNEDVAELSNTRGTISMANAGPDTGGSQFFINTKDNSFLDFNKAPLSSQHSVFGKVVDGMEVVDEINNSETGAFDRPSEAIVIEEIILEKKN